METLSCVVPFSSWQTWWVHWIEVSCVLIDHWLAGNFKKHEREFKSFCFIRKIKTMILWTLHHESNLRNVKASYLFFKIHVLEGLLECTSPGGYIHVERRLQASSLKVNYYLNLGIVLIYTFSSVTWITFKEFGFCTESLRTRTTTFICLHFRIRGTLNQIPVLQAALINGNRVLHQKKNKIAQNGWSASLMVS